MNNQKIAKGKGPKIQQRQVVPSKGQLKKQMPQSVPIGVEGILNPFNPEAEGLKLPDATSYPSLPFHVKTVYAGATSGTTGADCTSYLPFGQVAREVCAGVTSAGAITWTNGTDSTTSSTNWANYSLAMGLYRTVVGGVKVCISSSLLNTQGKLYICHVPIDNVASTTGQTFYPTTVAALMNMPFSEEYSLAELAEEELIIPFRRYSDVSEHYRDSTFPAGGASTTGNPEENACGWCAIVVLLIGASLTNVVTYDIEHIIICEGIELGNDTILATTPSASYDPMAMATIYQVNQAMPVASIMKDPEQGTWLDSALRKTKNTIQAAAKVAGFVSKIALLF
jgi:hypothetical protein